MSDRSDTRTAEDTRPSSARAAGDARVITGQRRALELVVHGAPLHDVLDVIVATIEAQSTADVLGSILLLDAPAGRLRHGAAPSLPTAYNAAIDGIAIGPSVGSCGTAAYTGRTVVVRDLETDPLWADFKDLALQHGLRACWSTPILSTSGEVLGTFALYHRVPATPMDRDREIVELLGNTAALVIERDREANRRAAAEAALHAIRERQIRRTATMFAHAPAAFALLRGPQHTFEVANLRYTELVGGRELLGRTLREAFPDLEGQGFHELLDEVRRTGQPYIGRSQRVMLARGRDGALEETFVDFVYQPLPAEQDGEAADDILVVAYEVTELVRARLAAETERARAEANERGLRDFVDNLPGLAWTSRPDGHIDYYNRRWYEYTGTSFEEMQGWGWQRVHDPDLLPRVLERWRHSLATGEPFEMELPLRGVDGFPRWFLTRVVPQRDGAGNIVRWFSSNTDIDAIKAAQALSVEMAAQSRETQQVLLEMRAENQRLSRRVAELEAGR